MAEYIEREALLRYLNDIWLSAMPNDSMPDDDRQLAIVRCMGLNDAMDAVKSIPAADVRPVVRGRWIKCNSGAGYKCSVCKARVSKAAVLNGNHHLCYKCGADMMED